MSPESEAKLAQVRKYSASLRSLFSFLQFVVVIGGCISVLLLLLTSGEDTGVAIGDMVFRGDELTPTVRILGVFTVLIGFGIAVKLVRHLRNLFSLYAEGRIFTGENVAQIRQIGISILLFGSIWVWTIAARLVLFALDHPIPQYEAGREAIGLTVNLPLATVVGGIIVIVISWIMDVGRELREEQDLTV